MTDNALRMLDEIKAYKHVHNTFIPLDILKEKLNLSRYDFNKSKKELEDNESIIFIPKNRTKKPKIKKNLILKESSKETAKNPFDFIPILQILSLLVFICITIINIYLSFIYFNEALSIFISCIFATSFVLFSGISFIGKFVSNSISMGNTYLIAFVFMVIVNTFFASAGQINGYYNKKTDIKSEISVNQDVINSIKNQTDRNKKALQYIEKQLESIDISDYRFNNKIERLKREQSALISKIDQNEIDLRAELKTGKAETKKGIMNIYKILAGEFNESKEGIIRLLIYIFPCLLLEVISALSLYFSLFIKRGKKSVK